MSEKPQLTISEALDAIGYGRFHVLISFIAGIGFLTGTMENNDSLDIIFSLGMQYVADFNYRNGIPHYNSIFGHGNNFTYLGSNC